MMKRCRAAAAIAAAGLWSASPLAAGLAPVWAPSVVDEEPQPPAKLNPTGRDIEMEVPLKLDGARLGDVAIKITADDKIFVDAKLLKTYLGNTFKQEILRAALQTPEDSSAQVADGETLVGKKLPGADSSIVQKVAVGITPAPGQLGREKPAYVALDLLVAKGLALRYNPNDLDLQVEPSVDQRLPSDISFAQQAGSDSASLEPPAYVSAYLNMRMTASYVSQSSVGGTGLESPNIDFNGAVRVGAVVLEGEGTLYTGASVGLDQHLFEDNVFYRRGTRLVYDIPEDAIRLRAGDVATGYAGFQTSPDLLGVNATQSYQQLQPGKTIRPTGAQSFRIERPSTVDVYTGDALVRRLRLGPGIYNISDLPLQAGANTIKLVIEDDTGARQTLEFTAFSGFELLAPGLSEWSGGAGIKSLDSGIANYASVTTLGGATVVPKKSASSVYGQRAYYFNQPAATAFYRRGITDAVTADADIQADERVVMAGGGFVTQTVAGMFAGELAASEDYRYGLGYAVRLGYGYEKFNWFSLYKASFRLLAEWRSPNFTTVETYANGVVAPQMDNASISASYTQHLPYDVTAGASLTYTLLYDTQASVSSGGYQWDAEFTASRRLWGDVTGSFSLGYGQDTSQQNQICCYYNRDGFRTFVRLSWVPDAYSNAMASYDSRTQNGQVTYSQNSETSGVGSWAATVTTSTDAGNDGAINASASYVANRAAVSVSHDAGLVGLGSNGSFNPNFAEERTSVSVASSFVYADGAWGVGRPVNGGFALVTPHPSLEGSPVVVGNKDFTIAESSMFGAAVVPNLGAYTKAQLTYDAPGAPAGYDLGSASYDLKAPYKAGYNLQAGSAYTITAMGTLLDGEGQSLPLLAGTAQEAGKENGRKVELFTNREGRFGAQGLAPGKWIIEMPTEPEPTRYEIDIPEGVMGLHNAGDLRPINGGGGGQQQPKQQMKPPLIEAGMPNEAT